MKTTRRQFCIVCILLISPALLGCTPLCAEEDPNQLMAKLEAKADEVKAYQADMTMTMQMMGQQMTTTGRMFFKKPKKSRMEMTMDMGAMKMEQLHISDGKTAWMYQPMMKMVAKIDMEKVFAETQDESAGQKNTDISKPFQCFQQEGISYVRTEDLDGSKAYVFHGSPGQSQMPEMPFTPADMEIWVNADNGLLCKIIMLDKEGKEMMTQSYSNIQTNVEMDDSLFEFTPPEGAQIMDMTEPTINMMKQMKAQGATPQEKNNKDEKMEEGEEEEK